MSASIFVIVPIILIHAGLSSVVSARREEQSTIRKNDVLQNINRLFAELRTILNSTSDLLLKNQQKITQLSTKFGRIGATKYADVIVTNHPGNELLKQLNAILGGLKAPGAYSENELIALLQQVNSLRSRATGADNDLIQYESQFSRFQNAMGQIAQIKMKIKTQFSISQDSFKNLDELLCQCVDVDKNSVDELKKRYGQFEETFEKLDKTSLNVEDCEQLYQLLAQLQNLSDEIAGADGLFTQLSERIQQSLNQQMSEEISNLISKVRSNETKRRKEGLDLKSLQQQREKVAQEKVDLEQHLKFAETTRLKISELLQYPTIDVKTREKLLKLQAQFEQMLESNREDIQSYYAITIQPRLKEITRQIKDYQKLADDFNQLYYKYFTLATEAKEEIQCFDLARESLPRIQVEIERLEKLLQHQDEMLHATDAITASLKEMGYEVIGEEKDLPDSIMSSVLLRDSKGNGVNFVSRLDGSFSVEYGALKLDDNALTYDEARSIAQDTKSFCQQHKQLKELLLANGVAIDFKSRSAPTAENAVMFNATNFNISKEVEQEIAKHLQIKQNATGQAQQGRQNLAVDSGE